MDGEQKVNGGLPMVDKTQLKPSSNNTLNRRISLSPVKNTTMTGFSPIRRSGSPVRRAKIHEIELDYARKLKRDKPDDDVQSTKVSDKESIPESNKRPKMVTFNKDVEYFESKALPSPKLNISKDDDTIDGKIEQLNQEIQHVKHTQKSILEKLEYIIGRLP